VENEFRRIASKAKNKQQLQQKQELEEEVELINKNV